MMDSDEADPNIQLDVDLMILDYLLCIGIDTLLHGSITGQNQTACWDNWVLDSVHTFRYIVPPSHTLQQDLHIKLQLLDFTDIFFHSYTQLVSNRTSAAERSPYRGVINPPTTYHDPPQTYPAPSLGPSNPRANTHLHRIIPEFMKLCIAAKDKVSITRWVDIVAQFMIQAAAEDYRVNGRQLPELTDNYLSWKPEDHDQTLIWEQATAKYTSLTQAQKGTSLGADSEATLNQRSLSRLEGEVISFLNDLMDTLEAPVLVQLERGQLGQLSRAETEHLKSRVGFR